ncbi:thioredoxin-related transmembrane protein 2-like [Gossypium australe]|uniref:Thioredoxin-related transmembrane protein 2-like n=1 Tax=Gossypium australe TaxID=47621 RepID=A0A5B6X758_9ROSI|nr:thioredoxin-related transmembrane protein 2-like [Gossypium australe]
MDKKRSNPMEWLNQMVGEPYYFFHFLAFFSYFIVRSSASNVLSPQITQLLFYRISNFLILGIGNSSGFGLLYADCIQGNRVTLKKKFFNGVMYCFFSLLCKQMAREETWEAFIADTLFFGKIFLIALTVIMDYHLTLWYLVVFSGIIVAYLAKIILNAVSFAYELIFLGSASKLTPLQLEALLTEGNTSRFWLVEFRASFSSSCRRASRCFPELSIRYSNKNLSFGIVDLGLFPNAAEKFGISPGGSMGQLPTYILFENAIEVSRFPEFNFEATPTPPITKRLLARHFELDRHLLEYVNGK